MTGHSVLFLIFSVCCHTSSAHQAACSVEDGEECAMSSMLLQTEKTINKASSLEAPIDTKAEEHLEKLAMTKMRAERLAAHMSNITTSLEQVMTTLDADISVNALSASQVKLFTARDAILLAVRSSSTSDADKDLLAPLGLALNQVALNIDEVQLSDAKETLQDVLNTLADVSLPEMSDMQQLVDIPKCARTLPAEHIFYGNWCGQFKPPGECGPAKDCGRPAIDGIDVCCKAHDDALAKAYPMLKCVKLNTEPTCMEGNILKKGDRHDCDMYSKTACEELVGYDQTLSACVAASNCLDNDPDCFKAKQDIVGLYGTSQAAYSAGEAGCPAIQRFEAKKPALTER